MISGIDGGEKMKRPKNEETMLFWMKHLLCGALIGAGAILPGVSGGVLAIIFGVYRPFMEMLTHPKLALPRYWRMLPPLGLGCCAGFLLFARGISAALVLSVSVTTWLFIGLICGTVPSLYREAGREGRGAASWVSLAVCALLVFGTLFYTGSVARAEVTPNFWWYNFCGALWGVSVIIPGITSSSIMMALGLYQPMMDGLARMDLLVLSACLPGMVLAILLLARFVTWLLRTHYSVAFHGILGIVLASTLVIIPTEYRGMGEMLLSAVCCVLGFLLAFLLARLDQKTK